MDQQVAQFCALTGVSASEAQRWIQNHGGLHQALSAYNRRSGTSTPVRPSSPSNRAVQPGRASPAPGLTRSLFKSFSDLVRENNDGQNTFAGGEKSGLEVTNPDDANSLVKDLLHKAQAGNERPGGDSDDEDVPRFGGAGYRLGDSTTPSQMIGSAGATRARKVTRDITFWKEGFQVGDGALYRYDDPKNKHILSELNAGRAPLEVLDVEFGQSVDVTVHQRVDESFQPAKRKQGGFQGSGQRLGSPVPNDLRVPEPVAGEKQQESAQEPAQEPQGDVSVQLRLANGQRKIFRCNGSDLVQKLYDFAAQHTPGREFTLNHAFPVKPITNRDATITEEGLVNAVVVQRWA